MKRLILIRHGETIWNTESKTQGCQNVGLTTKGKCQCEILGQRLSSMKKDYVKIYSSDLDRCYLTSEIINKYINVGVEMLSDLREMNFGEWEGLTTKEIKNKYKKDYYIWRNKPRSAAIPGAENLIDVQDRCLRAVNSILNRHKEGTILIVSHSVAIKTIVLGLLEIDMEYFYKISINNLSISEIELRNYGNVLSLLNDTNYLY